jgi:lipopolysaccharide export LptBFGC system permease protein LptF
MPFGYGLWVWLKSNPAAQWALGIVAAYVTFKLWLRAKIRSERKDAAEDATEEVIEQIEKETDNAIQRVEDDRDIVRELNERQLRKLAASSPNNRGRLQNPQAD